MVARVVVAVADERTGRRLVRLLAAPDVLLVLAPTLGGFVETPEAELCDVIIGSVEEDDLDIAQVLRSKRALANDPDLVFLTSEPDPDTESLLFARGAAAVVDARLPDDEVTEALRAVLDTRVTVRRQGNRGTQVVAAPPRSAGMNHLLRLADRVAESDTSVLLLGETGTGKEWVARRIHSMSPRAKNPFVAVSCAAIPEGLVESELFGHVKGAFTGAIRGRRGHFELADGGTLFLDEIGEVPRHIQVKMLRALQDHTFLPVGGERPVKVDVRIIAATNRDLTAAVEEGDFRQDLYYRLGVVTLRVPPLRERSEDVAGLVDAYARHFAERLGRQPPGVSDDALEMLTHYRWPGNIRELINIVERAVLLGTGSTLELSDLPATLWVRPFQGSESNLRRLDDGHAPASLSGTYSEARDALLEVFDRRYLVELLDSTGGRVGDAARRAGMSPRTLYTKMRRHGLRKEDFKP